MQGHSASAFSTPVWTYRVLFRVLSPLLLGYTLWRAYKDGGRRYLCERLGIYRQSVKRATHDNQAAREIWIHAASVGEVFTVLPLLKALDMPVLVTTMTPTGAQVLAQQDLTHVRHVYLPLDFAGACRRFFRHNNIRQGWVVETEIWPWLYASARATGIPLTIINARLSNKTSAHARGFMNSVFRRALQQVRILARSQDDAERFAELGASEALITVVGNLKYAEEKPGESSGPKQATRLIAQPYVLAASTHDDEELQLATAWCRQSGLSASRALLVIVPRHPERGPAIQKQLASHEIKAVLRSRQQTPATDAQVYIADTLGELPAWYSCAKAGFIGGSLIERGGHNMLEAARAGCPIVTGQYTFNFTDVVQSLIAENAIKIAVCADEVVEFFCDVLRDTDSFMPMAQRARLQAKRSEEVLQNYLRILTADAEVSRE